MYDRVQATDRKSHTWRDDAPRNDWQNGALLDATHAIVKKKGRQIQGNSTILDKGKNFVEHFNTMRIDFTI
jgi:hypothetical protein